MSIDLWPTLAIEQDPRVAHDGTASVVLVLHGGCRWEKAVQVFGDVCGALAVKNIVDDISWFQRAFKNRNVPLWIKESQNVLPT